MNQFRRRAPFLAAALAAASLLATACGLSEPSRNVIDRFTGTVELGGFVVHNFSVNKSGELDVTLTSILPDTGATLGVLYGLLASGSSTNCSPIQQNTAVQGRTALSNRITKGNYCLLVFDSGSGFMTRAQTYTAEVSHP